MKRIPGYFSKKIIIDAFNAIICKFLCTLIAFVTTFSKIVPSEFFQRGEIKLFRPIFHVSNP